MKYLNWILEQIKILKLPNIIRFPVEKRLEKIKKEKNENSNVRL